MLQAPAYSVHYCSRLIGPLLSVLMCDWPLSKNLNEENINKKLWITSFFKSSILILDVELLLT